MRGGSISSITFGSPGWDDQGHAAAGEGQRGHENAQPCEIADGAGMGGADTVLAELQTRLPPNLQPNG